MSGLDLNHYLFVGAVLFVCGVVCMATKRNGIGVLMGVELVLNGANVNFVAFSRYTPLGLDGQVISLFVIVLAAAEAAVALAIASVKGFLVAGYFMHLLSEKKLIYAVLLLTLFFLALLLWIPHTEADVLRLT